MNRLKTVALLAVLTALFGWGGSLLGGTAGMWGALAFAALMNLGTWWFSDRIVLKLHGAQEAKPAEHAPLIALVRNLAREAGIPEPRTYIIRQDAPNAFATGRSPERAAVAVTTGILEALDERELRGVLAHELSHILNRDTLVGTIAATFAGALGMLADMALWSSILGGRSSDDREGHPLAGLLGVLVAPLAATLIQLAVTRSREFLADETGARLSGDPMALASALQKIEKAAKVIPLPGATPASSHLFIVNPMVGENLAALFRTHPPTRERVRRLKAMAAGLSVKRGLPAVVREA
jgi:heat shock protein HtpX